MIKKNTRKEERKMKRLKKAIVCMMLVLTMGCLFTGCGKKVPTEKDVEKAYEKMEAGKISPAEYYEIADAYNNNEPLKSGGFFSMVGDIVIIGCVGVGAVVIVKRYKDKK